MKKNENVRVRALTAEEKKDMENNVFDHFAVYATFCPECGCVDRTNMYLMRANERVSTLHAKSVKCPRCGKCAWELGYPDNTKTGFVDYN